MRTGPRLLLVEDAEEIAALVASVLNDWQVEVTTSGQAALDRLDRDQFDLILLDSDLEDGPALEFLARLRAKHAGKLVWFSRVSPPVEAGLDGWLLKPLQPRRLRADLGRWA